MSAGVLAGVVLWIWVAAGGEGWGDDPPVYPPPDTQPVERPPNPFGPRIFQREDAVAGYIELSDGTLAVGRIYTTRDKPLRLYVPRLKRFLPIPLRLLRRITGHLEWARQEPEWRWKEMGSDDRIYTGRSYPVIKVYYTFTLRDGRRFTGHCQVQPLYVVEGKRRLRFILWQRHKGRMGQTVADLRYIKEVYFGEDALKRGRALLKKDPSRRATKQEGQPPRRLPPVLIGDPETMLVHRHTCRRAAKVARPVGFLSLAEAVAAGYRPCPECRPSPSPPRPTTRPASSAATQPRRETHR